MRRGEEGADWNTVKIPGPGHHDKVLDTSWILTNLSSSATYECIIQVKPEPGVKRSFEYILILSTLFQLIFYSLYLFLFYVL